MMTYTFPGNLATSVYKQMLVFEPVVVLGTFALLAVLMVNSCMPDSFLIDLLEFFSTQNQLSLFSKN